MPRDSQLGSSALIQMGICSVCKGPHRLYGNEGLVYRHGPHAGPCPGSGQLPLGPPSDHGAAQTSEADVGVRTMEEVAVAATDHPQTVTTLKHISKNCQTSLLHQAFKNPR